MKSGYEPIDKIVSAYAPVITNLFTPWTAYQLGIILVCFVMAQGVARLLTPPLERGIRRLSGQPALMRTLIVPLRRLHWILWALALWAAVIAMREITWPSRSYFISLASQLVAAWAVINIGSRVVRNPTVAQALRWIGWPIAALIITDMVVPVTTAMDSVAVTMANRRISMLMVLKAAFILILLVWLASVVSNFIEQRLERSSDLTPTHQVLFTKVAKATLIAIAFVLSLTAVGIDLTALAVFSGALGLGIGIGLQKVASNLISGVIILIDKSIKPGDVISLGDTFGWISNLQSRYVSVVTREGVEHLIPNENFIVEPVVNWSHSSRQIRLEITFGTSYSNDPHLTRKVAIEAAGDIDRVLPAPAPVCHVVGFGESSIDFVLRFWVRDPENGVTNIRGQVYLAIWDTFKDHDIIIPFPHRQLVTHEPVDITIAKAKNDS